MLLQYLKKVYRSWFRESPTVRVAFPLVFMTLVIAGAAAVNTSSSSYVDVVVDPPIIAADQEFFINVYAVAHTPANTVDIEVAYPRSQIKIEGIDVGESVITLWTEEPYWENGSMYFRGGVFRRGFVGRHLIARVRATGIQTGKALITTEESRFLAGDGKGTEIALSNPDTTEIYIGVSNNNISEGQIVGRIALQVITDLDGDGDVTLADISRFMTAWRTGNEALDFNGDGKMTFRDFAIILADSFFK